MEKVKKFEFYNGKKRKINLHIGKRISIIGYDFENNGKTLRVFISERKEKKCQNN